MKKRSIFFSLLIVAAIAFAAFGGGPDASTGIDVNYILGIISGTYVPLAGGTMSGVLTLNDGSPAASQDFVANAGISGLRYYLTEQASDLATYEAMSLLATTTLSTDTAVTLGAAQTLVDVWATPLGDPNKTQLNEGIYLIHLYVFKAAGSDCNLTAELWTRTAGGVETRIASSSSSPVTADAAVSMVDFSISVATAVDIATSTRYLVKLWGARATAPDVNVQMVYGASRQGYLTAPSASNIWARLNGSTGQEFYASSTYVATGSSARPSISFFSDPDTGIWNGGTNQGYLVAAGAYCARWASGGLTSAGHIYSGDATAGYPVVNAAVNSSTGAFTWVGNTNTGMGRIRTGEPFIAASGTRSVLFVSTGTLNLVPAVYLASTTVLVGRSRDIQLFGTLTSASTTWELTQDGSALRIPAMDATGTMYFEALFSGVASTTATGRQHGTFKLVGSMCVDGTGSGTTFIVDPNPPLLMQRTPGWESTDVRVVASCTATGQLMFWASAPANARFFGGVRSSAAFHGQ